MTVAPRSLQACKDALESGSEVQLATPRLARFELRGASATVVMDTVCCCHPSVPSEVRSALSVAVSTGRSPRDGETYFVAATDPRTLSMKALKKAAIPERGPSKLAPLDILGVVEEDLAKTVQDSAMSGGILGDSLLWEAEHREASLLAMASTEEINKARSQSVRRRPAPWGKPEGDETPLETRLESLGPGEGVAPALLVARQTGDKPGYNGWDLIVPSDWGRAWWVTMVLAGARAGGLEARQEAAISTGDPISLFPLGAPDTAAGSKEDAEEASRQREARDRRPKGKRAPVGSGLVEASMAWDWELLVPDGKISKVMRGRDAMRIIQALQQQAPNSDQCGDGDLVLVRIEMRRGGVPSQGAVLTPPVSVGHQAAEVTCREEEDKETSKASVVGFFLDTGDMDTDESLVEAGAAAVRQEEEEEDEDVEEEEGEEDEDDGSSQRKAASANQVVGFVLGGYYSVLYGKGIGIALCSPTKLRALCRSGELMMANTAAHCASPVAVRGWD